MHKGFLGLVTVLVLLISSGVAWAAERSGEKFYIVNDYRYQSETDTQNAVIGQSVCGSRCNALTSNYLNYTVPGGWRVIKTASNLELKIQLDQPRIGGECICIADEYLVIVDELNNKQPGFTPESAR